MARRKQPSLLKNPSVWITAACSVLAPIVAYLIPTISPLVGWPIAAACAVTVAVGIVALANNKTMPEAFPRWLPWEFYAGAASATILTCLFFAYAIPWWQGTDIPRGALSIEGMRYESHESIIRTFMIVENHTDRPISIELEPGTVTFFSWDPASEPISPTFYLEYPSDQPMRAPDVPAHERQRIELKWADRDTFTDGIRGLAISQSLRYGYEHGKLSRRLKQTVFCSGTIEGVCKILDWDDEKLEADEIK